MRYLIAAMLLGCLVASLRAEESSQEDATGPIADGSPVTTIEDLNAMVKAGNYHLIRKTQIGHLIDAVADVKSVDGAQPLFTLSGSWWAILHNFPKEHGLQAGDRIRFRALILDEAYSGLQLWTYSWEKVDGKAAEPAAPADEPVLTIEVRAAPRDEEPRLAKAPWHYKLFEKRIKEVEDKPVRDLLGNRLRIQLQKSAGLGRPKKPYEAADFLDAILRGRIIPNGKMRYHLQGAEECLVTTPAGEFRVGIFYAPVGYVVLPNGECYWFFFNEEQKR